ncbi:hypothetical protein SDJN02_14936, partial [Cucurbita argyrosperma subsp. argyrosperma]
MEREIGVAITRFPERDESINNDRGHLRNNNKSPQFLLHSTSFIQIHTTTETERERVLDLFYEFAFSVSLIVLLEFFDSAIWNMG